jgi:hypothetical protein
MNHGNKHRTTIWFFLSIELSRRSGHKSNIVQARWKTIGIIIQIESIIHNSATSASAKAPNRKGSPKAEPHTTCTLHVITVPLGRTGVCNIVIIIVN